MTPVYWFGGKGKKVIFSLERGRDSKGSDRGHVTMYDPSVSPGVVVLKAY